jgi:capsule polysaccharide export protein KpsE/RkpR
LEIYVDIVTKNAFASILPTIIDDFNKINRYIKSKSFKDAIRDPIPLFPFVEEREMGRISD